MNTLKAFYQKNATMLQVAAIVLIIVWGATTLKSLLTAPKPAEIETIKAEKALVEKTRVLLSVIDQQQQEAIAERKTIMDSLNSLSAALQQQGKALELQKQAIQKGYEKINRIDGFGADSLLRAYAEY